MAGNVHLMDRKELSAPYIASPLHSKELGEIERICQERQELIQGVDSIDDLNEISGRYLVEAHFNQRRSKHDHFAGIIHTMVQNKRFGGGGVMGVRICADERCGGVIPPDLYSPSSNTAACPKCGKVWQVNQVFAHRRYNLTNQFWAHALARTVLRFSMDADVKIVYFEKSLIKPTMEAKEGHKRSLDDVAASRAAIRKVVYSLGRLLKDLSSGVELVKAMRMFVEA